MMLLLPRHVRNTLQDHSSTDQLSVRRCIACAASEAAERPNIVFMLSDDQGWGGLSVAMHPDIAASKGAIFHTPSLEKLAAQGMKFSAGYATAHYGKWHIAGGRPGCVIHGTKYKTAQAIFIQLS